MSKQLADNLAPVQLGVGVRGATEHIGHKLKRLLATQSEWHVLHVDLSNAFNSVHRQAIQAALTCFAPSLLAWFQFTHGQSSPLFCNSEIVHLTRGAQQGDPLGTQGIFLVSGPRH